MSEPGITGLAQISGIDMSDPSLAQTERRMLKTLIFLAILLYSSHNFWSWFGR